MAIEKEDLQKRKSIIPKYKEELNSAYRKGKLTDMELKTAQIQIRNKKRNELISDYREE